MWKNMQRKRTLRTNNEVNPKCCHKSAKSASLKPKKPEDDLETTTKILVFRLSKNKLRQTIVAKDINVTIARSWKPLTLPSKTTSQRGFRVQSKAIL